jgi:hypothetical protein
MVPSLFSYATKELSQDAFFCWVLEWAWCKYDGSQMNKVAKKFIKEIINDDVVIEKKPFIVRQYKNIDFYIRINERITILFEDKTKTEMHDDQLIKYKEIIKNEYPQDSIFCIYLKTDLVFPNEKDKIEEAEYQVFDIFKIKNILNENIDNDIYKDYFKFINDNAKKYENVISLKFDKWEQNEWKGFCCKLLQDTNEYCSSGIWQGREFWLMFSESRWLYSDVSDETFYISLEIKHSKQNNKGRLCILLHIEKKRIAKYKISNVREKINKKLRKEFIEHDIKISQIEAKKQIEIAQFPKFPSMDNNGIYIDYKKSMVEIKKIIKIFKIME